MTEPYYADDSVTVYAGDCLDVLPTLPDASVDAVVTDPPAGISFMGRDWDHHKGGREQWSAWLAEVMREAYRIAKPGAHALVWALPRTSHWTAIGIEDAGWEIRDRITHLFGTGFPKSLDVSKAIDRRGGNPHLADEIGAAIKAAREVRGWTTGQADRHFCGGSTNWTWYEGRKGSSRPPTPVDFARIAEEWPELAPLAAQVAEVERETVGIKRAAIGLPGAGVPESEKQVPITAPATADAQRWSGWGTALKPAAEDWWLARKPLIGTVAANVLAHGTGALNIDGCRVAGAVPVVPQSRFGGSNNNIRTAGRSGEPSEANPAGRWPANVALDETAAAALDHMSGEAGGGFGIRGARAEGEGWAGHRGDRDRNSFAGTGETVGYGDTGGASRFFYTAKAGSDERITHDGVAHPTVKPLSLMRWLVRLVTPPGGLILDPFAGSGTTVEAAILEGFRCIAIEREADYLPLITQRINRRLDPITYLTTAGEDLGIFDFEEPA